MKIINTCDKCGAEQPEWMGGTHLERRSWTSDAPAGCFDRDHTVRYSQYYLKNRIALLQAES